MKINMIVAATLSVNSPRSENGYFLTDIFTLKNINSVALGTVRLYETWKPTIENT